VCVRDPEVAARDECDALAVRAPGGRVADRQDRVRADLNAEAGYGEDERGERVHGPRIMVSACAASTFSTWIRRTGATASGARAFAGVPPGSAGSWAPRGSAARSTTSTRASARSRTTSTTGWRSG